MNSFACVVASYTLNALWEIPLIAASGWVSNRLSRRLGVRTQHRVWVVVLLLSVTAPALPLWQGILPRMFALHGTGMAAGVVISGGVGAGEVKQPGGFVLPLWLIWSIAATYLGALTYFATRLLWLFAGARKLVRTGVREELSADGGALWARVLRSFAVGHVEILCAAAFPGVVTIGAMRPVILLPSGFLEQSTEEDFLSAMGHELAHIERNDYSKNLFYEAASLLAAFHPVVWMVKGQIKQSREMICDATVAERLVGRKAYRQSLLRLAMRMMTKHSIGIPAVGMFDASNLEKRIMAMKTKRSVPGRMARAGLSGCVALLLMGVLAAGSVLAKQVKQPATDHDGRAHKIYDLSKDKSITPPVLTFQQDARFSAAARRAKYQGNVVLQIVVTPEGHVTDIRVIRHLGMGLDEKAIEAVRHYRFKPAILHGHPVAVRVSVEVQFRLYGARPHSGPGA